MPNLNVAVVGSPDYAKGLGKRSTTSDITFYDEVGGRMDGENVVIKTWTCISHEGANEFCG